MSQPDTHKAACRGAATVSMRCGPTHMEECQACHMAVAWDLINHHFFGFKAGCGWPMFSISNEETAANG